LALLSFSKLHNKKSPRLFTFSFSSSVKRPGLQFAGFITLLPLCRKNYSTIFLGTIYFLIVHSNPCVLFNSAVEFFKELCFNFLVIFSHISFPPVKATTTIVLSSGSPPLSRLERKHLSPATSPRADMFWHVFDDSNGCFPCRIAPKWRGFWHDSSRRRHKDGLSRHRGTFSGVVGH
jgi:hypothetical protein